MTAKQCFTSCHCTCGDCPNAQYDAANNRYGFGIAEDMGLEKISCKECRYNTGKCEDCLFFDGSECADDRMGIEMKENER